MGMTIEVETEMKGLSEYIRRRGIEVYEIL
jgi:hypothetical protein